MAKRLNLSGVVQIEAVAAPDGRARQLEVVGGDPVLAEAALES
jgi:hypothetical protein